MPFNIPAHDFSESVPVDVTEIQLLPQAQAVFNLLSPSPTVPLLRSEILLPRTSLRLRLHQALNLRDFPTLTPQVLRYPPTPQRSRTLPSRLIKHQPHGRNAENCFSSWVVLPSLSWQLRWQFQSLSRRVRSLSMNHDRPVREITE